MKILLFHPVRLPPKDYGGVERVVLWLAEALVELGHEVWVGALEGSRMPLGVKLIEFSQQSKSALDLLSKLPPGLDMVHFHAPPEAGVVEKLPCASVVTIHGNGKAGEKFPRNSIFLSRDHAKRHGSQVFVHNGINPNEFLDQTVARKNQNYLFLSKTSWKVKNLKSAMKWVGRAGASLDIAGGKRPIGLRLASLFSRQLHWKGPVSGFVKAELLANAKGFLFPVIWPEPFGLVVVEALASGTSVLASDLGSLPELITPEVGRLISPEDAAGWIDAIRSGDWIAKPEVCKSYFLKRFTHLHMARNYLDRYAQVTSGLSLNPREPETL